MKVEEAVTLENEATADLSDIGLDSSRVAELAIFAEGVRSWADAVMVRDSLESLVQEHQVCFERVTADMLRDQYNNDRLIFKEPIIYGREIQGKITLPLDPERAGQPPVILVKDGRDTWIVNGNHRAFLVVDCELNPAGHDLYALTVESPEAYEALFDLKLTRRGTACPEFQEFERRPRR